MCKGGRLSDRRTKRILTWCFRPGFVPADLLALETLLIEGTRAFGPGKHSARQ